MRLPFFQYFEASRSWFLLLGAGILFSSFAIGAHAEPATGSRIDNGQSPAGTMVWSTADVEKGNFKKDSRAEAYQTSSKLARCMISMHRPEATQFLALSPSSASSAVFFKSFQRKLDDCIGYSMGGYDSLRLQISTALLRGMIAEAFLHSWPKPEFPAASKVQDSYVAAWMAADPQTAIVEEMSACLADAYPAQTVQVLASPVGSAEESQAIGNLTKVVPQCLAKGATLQMDATVMRSSLALAVYHRLVDPVPASGNPAKVN